MALDLGLTGPDQQRDATDADLRDAPSGQPVDIDVDPVRSRW